MKNSLSFCCSPAVTFRAWSVIIIKSFHQGALLAFLLVFDNLTGAFGQNLIYVLRLLQVNLLYRFLHLLSLFNHTHANVFFELDCLLLLSPSFFDLVLMHNKFLDHFLLFELQFAKISLNFLFSFSLFIGFFLVVQIPF